MPASTVSSVAKMPNSAGLLSDFDFEALDSLVSTDYPLELLTGSDINTRNSHNGAATMPRPSHSWSNLGLNSTFSEQRQNLGLNSSERGGGPSGLQSSEGVDSYNVGPSGRIFLLTAESFSDRTDSTSTRKVFSTSGHFLHKMLTRVKFLMHWNPRRCLPGLHGIHTGHILRAWRAQFRRSPVCHQLVYRCARHFSVWGGRNHSLSPFGPSSALDRILKRFIASHWHCSNAVSRHFVPAQRL